MVKRTTKPEPEPPLAALDLYEDQVRTNYRAPRIPGNAARDPFEAAANWERSAVTAPQEQKAALARVARASLTGESPRTRHGRWRRDLKYLEMVADEAWVSTEIDDRKYSQMVIDWRKREPPGFFARYMALRKRLRGAGDVPG